MTEQVDAIVIGAGVVGLAVARSLAFAGRETLVIEQHDLPGQETSSRNSGVIHSGIYYPTGSLKARLCVLGRGMLYQYCQQRDIAHNRCGKIIVAQAGQQSKLRSLHDTGLRNGVQDLEWLDDRQVRSLEPEVRCQSALWSPSTGIVEVHELMSCLNADLETRGGMIVFGTTFEGAEARADGVHVTITSGGQSDTVRCRLLVNCAGLHAMAVLGRIAGYPSSRRRTPRFARGHYFSCRGLRPFRHLVYPMPNDAGLGIHATLDIDGTTRFGPDVEWTDALTYDVDMERASSFYAAIREYWPGLPNDALQPAYAGIRPKLVGPGSPPADFEIEGPADHGVPRVINLLGIESPGLTSCLAIGEHVAALQRSMDGE